MKNLIKKKIFFFTVKDRLKDWLSALPGRQSTTEWYQSHGSKSGTRGLTIDILKKKNPHNLYIFLQIDLA